MIRNFHSPGRLGDIIFQLYTVKMLEGGNFYISLFHQGNWNRKMIDSIIPFIKYQEYINDSKFIDPNYFVNKATDCFIDGKFVLIDYDLHEAELDFNPDKFPEWHRKYWPGNCHLAKRYAVHFGIDWDPESIWLTAPKTKSVDVIFHAPMRRVRSQEMIQRFSRILRRLSSYGYSVTILSGENDRDEWKTHAKVANIGIRTPIDFLETSDYINSAKVFFGAVSSCNAIAEGLKKNRLLYQKDDCDNVYSAGKTGFRVNEWTEEEIFDKIEECLR